MRVKRRSQRQRERKKTVCAVTLPFQQTSVLCHSEEQGGLSARLSDPVRPPAAGNTYFTFTAQRLPWDTRRRPNATHRPQTPLHLGKVVQGSATRPHTHTQLTWCCPVRVILQVLARRSAYMFLFFSPKQRSFGTLNFPTLELP